jgi:dihydroxy-acid dehydratase
MVGGLIALLEDGDIIRIDAENNILEAELDEVTIAQRRAKWVAPEPRAKFGILKKYARSVSSASLGCVTDL